MSRWPRCGIEWAHKIGDHPPIAVAMCNLWGDNYALCQKCADRYKRVLEDDSKVRAIRLKIKSAGDHG